MVPEELLQRVREVIDQVPPIRDLDSLGCAARGSVCVQATSVTRNDLHRRMRC